MKKHIPVLLLLACGALISGTFYFLLKDRFESGDVYPPSSSMRSDPLGTMILFEGLQALPGVRVDRDHNAVNRLPAGRQTTYLHFAARSTDWELMPVDLHRVIDRFLLEGGRLVITLTPEYGGPRESKEQAKDKKDSPEKANKTEKKDAEKPDPNFVDLQKKWGLKLSRNPGHGEQNIAKNVSSLALPAELDWHGNVVLKDPDASWQIIYRSDQGAVLAEKKRGSGSIVIATDSYFVSNEALVNDRHPELLAWLVGPADHIVFDEAHLGIVESPGISALARKYQLHGGVAALIILAGLFIWKSSSPLVPLRAAAGKSADVLEGRAASAGFVSLLKRNIPRERILTTCLEEWKKAFAHGTRFSAQEKAAIAEIAREEEARPARERDPVTAYQKICEALRRHIS